jgi:hypothetical protein
MRRWVGAIAFAAVTSACGGRGAPSNASTSSTSSHAATPTGTNAAALGGTSAQLGGSIVARVGGRTIDASTVAKVARAKRVSVYDATRALVDEEIFAQAALHDDALASPGVLTRLDGVLARAYAARLDDEALAQGPITDDEIAATMGDDWIELSRPETRVAVHALVREGTPNGAALADQLHDLVAPTKTPQEFMTAAPTLPGVDGKQLVVEPLTTPFTRDGRLLSPQPGGLDTTFTEATFAIAEVGGTSPVVHTSFGWHVIRLVEIRPAFEASHEEKARKLQGKIVLRRLGDRFTKAMDALRAATPAQIVATDADLMTPKIEATTPQPPATGP